MAEAIARRFRHVRVGAGVGDPAAFKAHDWQPPPRPIRRTLRASDKLLNRGFVLLLVLAPLPIGGNVPFGWTLIALAVGALLTLWAFRTALWRTRERDLPAALFPAIGLLAVAVVWIVVQTLPFTPRDWHHPLWEEAAGALGETAVRGGISIDSYQSWTGLMRLLSYVGAFWLAFQLARTSGGARRTLLALVVAGAGYAVFGLLGASLWPEKILWFDKWYWMEGVWSTFTNRNSYAAYAGLGLLAASGLLIVTLARGRNALSVLPPRERFKLALKRAGWLGPVFVVLALALVLTSSRAGTASSAIGLAVLIGSLGTTRLLAARTAMVLVLVMTVFGGLVFALAGDDLAGRLAGTDLEQEGRFPIYARIIEGIGDFPLTGTGYGTFAFAFRPYVGQLSELWWDQAHDTYLELGFELGLPATVALIAAVLVPVVICARGLRARARSALYPSLALGATTLLGLHALLDFSIEMPAIAVTYAAILGTGCARALPSGARRFRHRRGRQRRWIAPGFAAGLACAILVLATPRLVAQVWALPATLLEGPIEDGVTPPLGKLDRAIAAARGAGAITDTANLAWVEGRIALAQAHRPGLPDRLRRAWFEHAAAAMRRSLGAAPANPAAWAQLAYVTAATRPTAPLVEQALKLSVLTGPSFLPQLPVRAMVAAAVWDRLDRQTRALYRSQFVYGMRLRPQELVRALARVADVRMVYASLRSEPELLIQFDRIRRSLGSG